jgi:GGDEF domain-containing protein
MANDVVISDQGPKRALTYNQTRILLLSAGLLFLGVTAGVGFIRRVETAEVVAILLFIPIFVAFVFWDWVGGAVAAALATIAYIALRADAIQAVGLGQFFGVIVSRSLAFFAFGMVGGFANRYVRGSLTKLDLYDHVDDTTGLMNARAFLEATDLEMSRAGRYQSLFSVSVVDIPAGTFGGVSRRRRNRVLREIGMGLRSSVRTVDRVAHASDGRQFRFAAVLPETGVEGAQIFTERLGERLSALLGIESIHTQAITFPGDDDALNQLRSEFAAIDRAQHPEQPTKLGIVAA